MATSVADALCLRPLRLQCPHRENAEIVLRIELDLLANGIIKPATALPQLDMHIIDKRIL